MILSVRPSVGLLFGLSLFPTRARWKVHFHVTLIIIMIIIIIIPIIIIITKVLNIIIIMI